MILASYNNNRMINADCFIYKGNTVIPFKTITGADETKLLIWKDFETLIPLCDTIYIN